WTHPATAKRHVSIVRNRMSYADTYLSELVAIAGRLDAAILEAMAERLAAVRDGGGRLFIIGVGGGAGHASHAVNDFRKIGGFECYAPTDNVSELTARINDDGWDGCFREWLRGSRLGERDGIFVFSVGGGKIGRASCREGGGV